MLRRIVIVLLLAGATTLMVVAFSGGGSGDPPAVDDAVELQIPAPNSLVVRQAEVGVDLRAGFAAELVIDGTTIPLDQLSGRRELDQYFFQPGEGKEIEELEPGRRCVTAVIRDLTGAGDDPNPVNWCFNVS